MDEQPLIAGIHGLATHEMYCPKRIATFAVALTPPFHPYPCGAVIFCYTCYTLTDIKPLACVALCVARTFLPLLPGGDGADLRGKGSENEHRIKQTRLFFMSSASYPSVKVSENEYRVMSLFDAAVLPGSKA